MTLFPRMIDADSKPTFGCMSSAAEASNCLTLAQYLFVLVLLHLLCSRADEKQVRAKNDDEPRLSLDCINKIA